MTATPLGLVAQRYDPTDARFNYLNWENTESIQYQAAFSSAGPGIDSNRPDYIQWAKRRAITTREKSPSGGVYVGSEMNWRIPSMMLQPGFVPKPGDVILARRFQQNRTPLIEEDGDRVRWTVLTTKALVYGTVWELGCLDLALAWQLLDTVSIEQATVTYDASGAAIKVWPPNGGTVLYPSLAARCQLQSGDLVDERGVHGMQGTYTVFIDRQLAFTTSLNEFRMAVTASAAFPGTTLPVYLDIKGYRNAQRIDELPQAECLLKV